MTTPGNALQVALAIDVPDREATLIRIVNDPAFTVGRLCEVAKLCASIRDLEHVMMNSRCAARAPATCPANVAAARAHRTVSAVS